MPAGSFLLVGSSMPGHALFHHEPAYHTLGQFRLPILTCIISNLDCLLKSIACRALAPSASADDKCLSSAHVPSVYGHVQAACSSRRYYFFIARWWVSLHVEGVSLQEIRASPAFAIISEWQRLLQVHNLCVQC